ncbi:SCO family protein [Epibacterium sp. SM1969]|uniref:SCO family protein n=1 Tax=Tritonibacter aquimaris TaxID=2663379 RepID=A0A844ANG3_9RHOB|nr:SCO family protein [Tritonibacter aquimaris]MQY41833.1 SCO family protein [Tritonibacter aquimaris]
MSRIFAVVAASVAIAGLGAAWIATQNQNTDAFANCRTSTIAGGAGAIGGPFELVNTKGQIVTDTDVVTEPTLIYFGYTFCPDVCPLDNARNAEAIDILAQKGVSATPVFISIDPERDTPEVMADFSEIIHDKLIGLTGSAEQVKAASKAYKTYYQKQDGDDEYYLVNHSTYTYLVLPELGFVDFFKREETAQQMADRVGCFVENA